MLDRVRHSELFRQAVERYEFRVATPEDAEGIVALWPEHWAEAHYHEHGIEPDEDRYRDWVATKLEFDGNGAFLLATLNEVPIGFFAYTLDHTFSKKPVAVMGSFFVRKEHRRSAVPALLFELGVDLAKADGACAFHAPIASGSLAGRSLENSFRKHGFDVMGTMMGKGL